MTDHNEHGRPNPLLGARRRADRDIAQMLTEDEAMALVSWVDDPPDVAQAWPGSAVYGRLRHILADRHASLLRSGGTFRISCGAWSAEKRDGRLRDRQHGLAS